MRSSLSASVLESINKKCSLNSKNILIFSKAALVNDEYKSIVSDTVIDNQKRRCREPKRHHCGFTTSDVEVVSHCEPAPPFWKSRIFVGETHSFPLTKRCGYGFLAT